MDALDRAEKEIEQLNKQNDSLWDKARERDDKLASLRKEYYLIANNLQQAIAKVDKEEG